VVIEQAPKRFRFTVSAAIEVEADDPEEARPKAANLLSAAEDGEGGGVVDYDLTGGEEVEGE
jgi:hypothetical protein